MDQTRSVSPTTSTSTDAHFDEFHVVDRDEHSTISTKLFFDILENPKGRAFATKKIFGSPFNPLHAEALKLAKQQGRFTLIGATYSVASICTFLNSCFSA